MNTQTFSEQDQQALIHSLPLIIEGKPFTWEHQYITGSEIKKLGGLSPESEMYLAVTDPWKDERIGDETRVDLARPGIEQFYIRKPLPYFIGEIKFESESQWISGAKIRKKGNIPADYKIFLTIKGPWEDEPVEDSTWIDLARPGIEHFYSCKPNTNNG